MAYERELEPHVQLLEQVVDKRHEPGLLCCRTSCVCVAWPVCQGRLDENGTEPMEVSTASADGALTARVAVSQASQSASVAQHGQQEGGGTT